MNTSPFSLRKDRDFNAVMNDTFNFIKIHWRIFLECLLRILLPLGIVQAIAMAVLFGMLPSIFSVGDIGEDGGDILSGINIFGSLATVLSAVFAGVFSLIGLVLSYATTLAIMRLADERGTDFEVHDVHEIYQGKLLGLFGLSILYSIIVIFGILFCVVPGVYLAISLSLCFYCYFIGNDGVVDSLKHSMDLVKDHWLTTFGIAVVLYMIVGSLGFITGLPQFIMQLLTGIAGVSSGDPSDMGSWWMIGLNAITMLINVMGRYTFQIILIVGMGLLYYSLTEKKEAVGLAKRVASLNQSLQNDEPTTTPYSSPAQGSDEINQSSETFAKPDDKIEPSSSSDTGWSQYAPKRDDMPRDTDDNDGDSKPDQS